MHGIILFVYDIVFNDVVYIPHGEADATLFTTPFLVFHVLQRADLRDIAGYGLTLNTWGVIPVESYTIVCVCVATCTCTQWKWSHNYTVHLCKMCAGLCGVLTYNCSSPVRSPMKSSLSYFDFTHSHQEKNHNFHLHSMFFVWSIPTGYTCYYTGSDILYCIGI